MSNLPPPPLTGNPPPSADALPIEGALWLLGKIATAKIIPLPIGEKGPPPKGFPALATREPDGIARWEAEMPGRNYGLVGVNAIDVDLKDDAPGVGNFNAWRQALRLDKASFADCLIVRSASGGWHTISALPDGDWRGKNGFAPKGVDFTRKPKLDGKPGTTGIDLKGAGNTYLVCVGGRVTGQDGTVLTYDLMQAPEGPVGLLPAAMLASIKESIGAKIERCSTGAVAPGADIDSDEAITAARGVASSWEPSVENNGGHDALRDLVMRVGDLGLSAGACTDLLREANGWNERCLPPWDDDDIEYQITTMYDSRATAVGCSQPGAEFAGVALDVPASPSPRAESYGLVTRTFDTIELRAIEWLWLGLIPRGYLTIIAGETGAGKSTVLADIVARITTGAPWPGEFEGARRLPGRVLWLGAEDSAAEMTGPRLKACGADMTKIVEIIGSRRSQVTATFSLQDDLENCRALLAAALGQGKPFSMLVIDPITSYLPGQKLRKVDFSDAGQLRSILEPWLRLAEEFTIALACVTHFGKDTNRSMLHRVLGSAAFAQICRSLLAVIPQPPGVDGETDPHAKALLQVKTNLPEHPGGAWLFRTERLTVGTDPRNNKPILATRPVWGVLDAGLTPERANGGGHGDRGLARKDAAFSQWLFEYFHKIDPGAWTSGGEVKAAAMEAGVATARWWQDHSQRFLEKQNADGKWLCRLKQGPIGSMDGSPIVRPEFNPGSSGE